MGFGLAADSGAAGAKGHAIRQKNHTECEDEIPALSASRLHRRRQPKLSVDAFSARLRRAWRRPAACQKKRPAQSCRKNEPSVYHPFATVPDE